MLRPANLGSTRSHSNFQTRTAADDAGELNRSSSFPLQGDQQNTESQTTQATGYDNPYEPATNDSTPPPRQHSLTRRLLHLQPQDGRSYSTKPRRSVSGRRRRSISRHSGDVGADSLTAQMVNTSADKKSNGESHTTKPGLPPRPVGGDEKLGMFSGVYVPTCLNVLSVLMFLRFSFILGQINRATNSVFRLTGKQAREESSV